VKLLSSGKYFVGLGLTVGLIIVTGLAHAASERFYITAGPSYTLSDAHRQTEDAPGVTVGVGLSVHPRFDIEFSGLRYTLQHTRQLAFKQSGWLLDGLLFFTKDHRFSSYAILGVGMIQSEYAAVKKNRPAVNAGIGLSTRLSERLHLQTDLRYRYDHGTYGLDFLQENAFGDWIIHVGLAFPLDPVSAMDKSKDKGKPKPGPRTKGPSLSPVKKKIPSSEPTKPIITDSVIVDKDEDGVPDIADTCLGTPFGARVHANGCELDNDGDGVVNSSDLCPDSSLGIPVDKIGCTLMVGEDEDHDGVFDVSDVCPATPPGTMVDASGCEPDQHNNVILQNIEACLQSYPNGGIVDCEIPGVIVLEGVQFGGGSDRFSKGSTKVLAPIAALLQRNPEVVVEVAGYTDNKGSAAANHKLSEKRARAIANYFILKGVLDANLIINGHGPDNPIADNNTPEGRAKNRRVELHIVGR
jgi:OOP family OmpA-OmpF porin